MGAQNGLGLTEEQCKYSWEELDQYGNMLSPSGMFVLELILKEHNEKLSKGEEGFSQGLAFSFSPGVGAEGILLKVLQQALGTGKSAVRCPPTNFSSPRTRNNFRTPALKI